MDNIKVNADINISNIKDICHTIIQLFACNKRLPTLMEWGILHWIETKLTDKSLPTSFILHSGNSLP